MLDAFVWWLTSFAIGLVALPITCRLFRWLPDQGYAFGRPLGILLFSYIFWVLGMANVLPNDRLGVAVSLLLVIAVAAWVAVRNRKALLRFVVSQWRVILITEMVFIVIFVVWGLVRSYTPTIAHTEQPMDFALLNAILASPEFPPSDPWFSGEPISYYYFGYLMHAGLTTLTGIPSSISYNLALMSTAAMTATGIMSLVYNLVRSVRRVGDKRASAVTALGFGLAAVLLMLFLGNLVGALEFLRVNNVGSVDFYRWVDIDGLLGGVGSSTWYPSDTWWWWRSTRVINTFTDGVGIDYTITEFPFFSFLLGDLHPHVMALPFTLLAIAVSCSLFRMPAVLGIRWIRDCPGEVLLCTLIFGSLGFLNSWDLPTFIALLSFVLLLKAFYAYPAVKPATMMSAGLLIVFMVLGSLALYLPFYLDLETQASGLLPVRRTMTRPLHFALVWGPFLLMTLCLVGTVFWRMCRSEISSTRHRGGDEPSDNVRRWSFWRSSWVWAVSLSLAPFCIWAFVELGMAFAGEDRLLRPEHTGSIVEALLSIGSRFWHLFPLFLILSLAMAVLFRKSLAGSRAMQFVMILIVLALFLMVGSELFYISDFFGNRMNTVFKFYYQAWSLMVIASTLGLYYLFRHRPRTNFVQRLGRSFLLGLFAVLVLAAFVYVPAAIYSKSEGFRSDPTLDALASSRISDPAGLDAIDWLSANAERGAIIVEALPRRNGLPIGDYDPSISRVSQRTGLPTILGWPGHEHQWRGDPFDPIAERSFDVESIFLSTDKNVVLRTLAKYGVTYVYEGDLERRIYGRDISARFADILDIAFQNDSVVIYQHRSR